MLKSIEKLNVVVLMLFAPSSLAQQNIELLTTENPEAFTELLLEDFKEDGFSVFGELAEKIGVSSPQFDAAVSLYSNLQGTKEQRWTSLVGVEKTENESFVRVYAYTYGGNNSWAFHKLDFVRISETGWALSSSIFIQSLILW